jgi:excisionase family DNA binding protein
MRDVVRGEDRVMATSDLIEPALSSQQRTRLLTPKEVAELLRVTPRTVRRWAAEGHLQRVRPGGRLSRYTPESVESLIRSTTNSEAPGSNRDLAKNADAGGGHATQ